MPPFRAFAIMVLTKARYLLISFGLPSSVTVIFSSSSSLRSVAKFRTPLGRPRGLPDLPGLNRVSFGGIR